MLGFSVETIRKKICARKIPHYKLFRRIRIDEAVVKRILSDSKIGMRG